MSRVKTGRGRGGGKCCLTCLIISIVILVLSIGGIMVGANFAFNKFVSPYIGGVTLTQSLSLLRGIYKADRDAIVTDEFGTDDLDAFYESLNTALFQQPYTEEENNAINLDAYNALSEDERNAMSEDERAAFLARQNYRINIRSILEAVNFDEMVSEGQGDDGPAEAGDLAAAEEGEGGQEVIEELLKNLLFNFSTLSTYDEDDAEAEDNSPFVSLSITGKQLAAVVNEIVSVIFSGEGNPLSDIEQLEGMDVTEYLKIPQVKIEYTKTLEECASQEEFDNSVRFTLTVELQLGNAVDWALTRFADEIPSEVPPFLINFARKLIPNQIFVTAGVYPLDATQEIYFKINNFTDEQVDSMNKIVNAVGNLMSNDENEGEEPEEPDEENSMLQELNSKVAEVFTKIKDQNIAFDFVDAEGAAAIQFGHIETLLSLMGLIDPEDPDNTLNPGELRSVTPHMFLSAMKCLTVSYDEDDEDYDEVAKNYSDTDRTTFLAALEGGFGIQTGYLSGEGVNILDSAILETLPDHISLSDNINYDLTPAEMRVDLADKALAAILTEALASGLLTGGEGEGEGGGEEGEGAEDYLSKISFNQLAITKSGDDVTLTDPVFFADTPEEFTVSEALQRVYELKLVMCLSLDELLSSAIGEEGEEENSTSELIEKVFGSLNSLYISAGIFIEEISDPITGEIYTRTVGGTINPAAFKVNKFSYANTDKVFQTITLMMMKLNKNANPEEENPFDFTQISGKVEEMLGQMLDTLETNLKAELRLATGKIVLPSIYEVISGVIKEKAEAPEDEMSADEVHGVFKGIYDSGIEVVELGATPSEGTTHPLYRYDEAIGDVFLSALSDNYYMREQIDTAALFDSEQINGMFTASSLNFTGEAGLYSDDRAMDVLSVPMTGDAMATLLIQSGQLDALGGESGDGMLKSLDIINAVIRADGDSLYIDFELVANLKDEEEPAPAEEGFSAEGFLPELIYVTASVLIYADAYLPEAPRFTTTVAVNKMDEEDNSNLFKLIRLLTGEDAFDTASVTSEIESALESSFQSIEDNINMAYHTELVFGAPEFESVKNALNATYGDGTADDGDTISTIMLANVFNTINKLSNKEDPLYVEDEADDAALRARLKEFGRRPEKEYDITNTTGVSYLNNLFMEGDSDAFVNNFNRYYYINQTNRMEADAVFAEDGFFATATDSADTFNFKSTDLAYPGLYLDTEEYDEDFAVKINDKALAEMIYLGSGERDPITGERDHKISFGTGSDYAFVVQTKIYEDSGVTYLSITMQVYVSEPAPEPGEEEAEILPEYLFVTLIMDLEQLLTDPESLEADDVILYINGMNEAETDDFFERIDKMSTAMGFDLEGFSEQELKDKAVESIKSGFEQVNEVDGVTYGTDAEGGYMQLPDVFTYLVDYCEMTEPSEVPTTGEALHDRMREFGRTPTATGAEINEVTYYSDVDISEFDALAAFDDTDAKDFLVNFNRNYYLAEEQHLNVTSLFSGTFTINSSSFNFKETLNVDGEDYPGLYIDDRDYSELAVLLTEAQLGSLIKQKEDGFAVGGGGESPDTAEIVQISIIEDGVSGHILLKAVSLYTPTTAGNVMPDYLFVTSYTDIDAVDGFGEKTYETYILVNDLDEDETTNFFRNINSLQTRLGISSNVQKSTIESAISDKMEAMFSNELSAFGELEWNDGFIELPDIFEYITDNVNGEAGMLDYTVDGSGNIIMDSGNPVTVSTSPENLMDRLRELGREPDEGQSIAAEMGITYNDNRYAGTDDDYFYTYLKDYYYFNDEPTPAGIYGGDIFTNIDSDSFNFTGNDSEYTAPDPSYYGLYYYDGDQFNARLSDRALAAILAENSENVSSASMTVAVESLKMYYDLDTNLVFEITSKAEFTGDSNAALPDYIYITSFTTRTDDGLGGFAYSTRIVVNGFAVVTGNTDNLSYNLSQMSAAFGLDFDAFDTADVATNISDLVERAMDNLSTGVNISYKTYADDPVPPEANDDGEGIGYIEFKSIYGIIADNTLAEDTVAATALTMQGMIIKLHDPDIYDELDPKLIDNPKASIENPDVDMPNATSYTTDRVFACRIGEIEGDGVTLDTDQAMFMSINSDASVRTPWETRFNAASESGFAFGAGADYIEVTGNINISDFRTSTVKLLPDTIYASLIMDADDTSGFEPILMFNEMNFDEMELFMDIADGGGEADLDTLTDNMVARINNTMSILLVGLIDGADEVTFHVADPEVDPQPDYTYPLSVCVGYLRVYDE